MNPIKPRVVNIIMWQLFNNFNYVQDKKTSKENTEVGLEY